MRAVTGCLAHAAVSSICLLFAGEQALQAVDCSRASPFVSSVSFGSSFNITFAGFSREDIDAGIAYWSGCPGYESEIPEFLVDGVGGVPVIIVKVAGVSQSAEGGCGEAAYEIVNGHIEGVNITIWETQRDGASCMPYGDMIAHELGHVLGLGNALENACVGRIMGRRAMGLPRRVESDDCVAADDMWETPEESQPPPPDPFCEAYCWMSCTGSYCPPGPYNPYAGSPVLLDLENNGVRLTGLGDPVWFDINADGQVDLMSWTDRGEGILALDRNGNGVVDHGGELFGNFTSLSDGSLALNGYEALAELDTWALGGNQDGLIDLEDAAYLLLRLWSDLNHNGLSEPSELLTLDQARVTAIGLSYRRSNRTDRHGNEFRFRGRAWKRGPNGVERPVPTWDVFFLVVP